ncbi:hypothetical protein N665_0164s0019 [Sinapis alba]|nr:hypothetical protein N665_0164s0019 [Sinapis alba]
MPRLVNQSSVDENLAMLLQFGLSEDSDLTVNDVVIAREIQQQYQNNSTLDDAAIALEIQQQEDILPTSLSDDEKFARYLQQQDEWNNSYIPERDAPSTSRTIIQYENDDDDDHFLGHHTHTRTPSNSPSIGALNLSTNENIESETMTYEELNDLEDSMGNVNRGLSQRRISKLPTYKYGVKTKTCCWKIKKKKFMATDTQCTICLVDYVMGDKITTLPCKHIYHKDCISQWLTQSNVCCVCKAEV